MAHAGPRKSPPFARDFLPDGSDFAAGTSPSFAHRLLDDLLIKTVTRFGMDQETLSEAAALDIGHPGQDAAVYVQGPRRQLAMLPIVGLFNLFANARDNFAAVKLSEMNMQHDADRLGQLQTPTRSARCLRPRLHEDRAALGRVRGLPAAASSTS
jgi:hypothetical protein